jgi:hypothetical protein
VLCEVPVVTDSVVTGVDDAVEMADELTVLAGVIVTVLPVVRVADVSVVAAVVLAPVCAVADVAVCVVSGVDVTVDAVPDEAVEPAVDDSVLPVPVDIDCAVVGIAVLEIPVRQQNVAFYNTCTSDADVETRLNAA